MLGVSLYAALNLGKAAQPQKRDSNWFVFQVKSIRAQHIGQIFL